MGRDKAMLPFGGELMLQRVVRILSECVETQNLVVVAAAEQALPELPSAVRIVRDAREFQGPLEGLATGLRAINDRARMVFVSACDAPLLIPAFVKFMFESLGDCDIAAPFDGHRHYPLSAVYRAHLLPRVEEMLDDEHRKLMLLYQDASVRAVSTSELCRVDPALGSLRNINTEDDYRQALAQIEC